MIVKSVIVGVTVAGIVVSTFACSSTTSTTTPDQACADVARARCGRIATCSSLVFAVRYTDEATCESRDKANCMAALAAPSTGNTAAATEACATALGGTVDCPSFLANTPPAGCETKAGMLPIGAACAFNAQCQTTFCSVGLGSLCATCTPVPAAGASCAMTFCGPGLICSPVSETCGTPVQAGAACDTAPCATVAVCAGAAGKRTCSTAASAAASGEGCGLVNGARVECAAQGICKFQTGQTSGTCLAAAADGAPCDETNGPLCAIPARCISGNCQVPSVTSCH